MASTSTTLPDRPNSDHLSKQHEKFRYLIALIRFLRTINDTGYPSLNETSINENVDPPSTCERILDALTTILVLNHEVVAAVPLHGQPEKAIIVSGNGDSLPEGDQTKSGQLTFDDELDIVFEDEMKTERSPSDGMSTSIRVPDDDNGGIIFLVEGGQDFWPRCQTGDFDELVRNSKRCASPLASHVKTINSYLHARRMAIGTDKQTIYEGFFKTYLFISCYRKMYRRFATWSALGLIYNLAHISREHLEQVVSQARFDTEEVEPDRSLGNLLGNLPVGDLEILVESGENLDVPVPDLEHLQTVVKDSGFVGVYRKDTVIEFHYFLLRLLIVFARRLSKVSSGQLDDIFITTRTVPTAEALAVVAHSSSLLRHLIILTKTRETLSFPTIGLRQKYAEFALKLKMPHRSLSTKANLGKGAGNGSDVGRSEQMEHSAASGYSEGNSELASVGDDEQWEQGEEFVEMARSVSRANSGGMFRRWIESFISHLSAKRALEWYSTKRVKNKDILIQALGTKRSKPAPVSRTTMMDLIRELTNGMDEDVNAKYEGIGINSPRVTFDNAISDMKSHITAYRAVEDKSLYNKIYEQFEQLLMNEGEADDEAGDELQDLDLFNGGLHSEAILAAAALCGLKGHVPDNEENEQLLNILQKMDVKDVSVSELCCPICWDLLEILRDGKVDALRVRGRHSILYDVELPSWLSIDALEKMVAKYTAYAKTELKNLQRFDKNGNRHISGSRSDANFTSGYSVNVQKMHGEKMSMPVG